MSVPASYAQASYAVIEHGDAGPRPIGQVTIGSDGRIGIANADEGGRSLAVAAEEVNQLDAMHQDAPAPAGASRFRRFARAVPRGAPDFIPGMLKHLRTYYGLELVPLAPPPPNPPPP